MASLLCALRPFQVFAQASSSPPLVPAPSETHQGVSAAVPDAPLPGQRLPPCKKPQVEINGSCWTLVGDEVPPCSDVTYEWRKRCYAPALGPSRPFNTREK